MSDKNKIKCPYCSEKIQAAAQKCRFCGEWLIKEESVQKEHKKLLDFRYCLIVWIYTMVAFFGILAYHSFNMEKASSAAMWGLGIDVLVGVIVFILLLTQLNSALKIKENRKVAYIYTFITLGLFVLFFYLLMSQASARNIKQNTVMSCPAGKTDCLLKTTNTRVCMVLDECLKQNSPSPSTNTTKNTTTTKTATKVQASTITCIGPDGKQFVTTMDECKKLNEKWGKPVDYMINCNIHPDCGGGTVYMAKSECDKPCSGRKQTTTTTPTNNITSPVSGSNFFCVNNVTGFTYYTSSGEQCNKDNTKAICLDAAKKLYYNPCMDDCLWTANNTSTHCIYDLTGDAQTACLDQKTKDHQSCMDACGVIYQAENKKCY